MLKLLIVEDDTQFLNQLHEALKSQYNVTIATTVPQALKALGSENFDIVLCDYLIANDDCFSVLNFIKSLLHRPKIFIMTAYTNLELTTRLLNEKIDGYLEKPFTFNQLFERINSENLIPHSCTDQFILNSIAKTLTYKSQVFHLTDVELKLLSYFENQREKWIQREDLINFIWQGPTGSRNTLDTHLTNLKKKVPVLKERIKTQRGKGFFYSLNLLDPDTPENI